MAEKLYRTLSSPRHGLLYSDIPTKIAGMYGGSLTPHTPENYGKIIDCVYEMTDQISTSNGWSLEKAMEHTLNYEGWRVLPKHKKMIIERLKQDERAS